MFKGLVVALFFITFLYANDCHQTLVFDDMHHLKISFDGNANNEDQTVKETLYINHVEDKESKYSIFWFGNPKIKKSEVDIESINAPFVVRYTEDNISYSMEELSILSKDKRIEALLWAKVNILQFASKDGLHHFKNHTGYIEAEQEFTKDAYLLKRLRSFDKNKEKKEVRFEKSTVTLQTFKKTCAIWKNLELKESISSVNKQMKISIQDERELKVFNSKDSLEKEHWFYKLPADIRAWNFKAKDNNISLSMAQSMFKKNQKEMSDALGDTLIFGEWVQDNIDFLKHLSVLLENNTLDDNVSRKLFAKLGYLDSVDTTNILSQVGLNDNIIEKERFRGLMGLKNTSAPIDDDLLAEILDYGLSADNNPDATIQNMTGMIAGGLAKERMKRSPEQAEKIVDAIIDAVNTKENKTIALGAAGNLQELAPAHLVEAVDNILLTAGDADTRAKSANVLSKIDKSTLATKNFQELIANETNSITKTSLIKASASSTDFQNNPDFNAVLVDIAQTVDYSKNKIAALNTLEKSSYAQTKKEKAVIRKMMIGERDGKTLQALKSLYRK